MTNKPDQAGITLLETIVAVLLVASGVIGIAAIYAQQQNIARGGRVQQHAVALAREMAAQIRHNDNPKNNFETALGTTCELQPERDSATNRVACWQDVIERELTNGSARISLDRNAVPAQYVIVVSWSEPRTGTASYVLRVTPGTAPSPGRLR